MSRPFYENFDVVFSREADQKYRATVQSELGGDNSVTFALDQAPDEILRGIGRNFNLGIAPTQTSPATNTSSQSNGSVDVGKYLFEQLFQSSMLATFQITRER